MTLWSRVQRFVHLRDSEFEFYLLTNWQPVGTSSSAFESTEYTQYHHVSCVCVCVCVEVMRWSLLVCGRQPVSRTAEYSSSAQATLREVLGSQLQLISDSGTWKSERVITSCQGPSISVHGQRDPVLNFCANNYLGLSVCCSYCLYL